MRLKPHEKWYCAQDSAGPLSCGLAASALILMLAPPQRQNKPIKGAGQVGAQPQNLAAALMSDTPAGRCSLVFSLLCRHTVKRWTVSTVGALGESIEPPVLAALTSQPGASTLPTSCLIITAYSLGGALERARPLRCYGAQRHSSCSSDSSHRS